MRENLCRCTSNKGLITRIHRELKKLDSQEINNPVKKWANELNRASSKEEVQMKKCSPSLARKEMQIKTMLRFHLTLVRITIIKNTNNNKYWHECQKMEPSYTAGGNVS
jgi:hypothetical protein